MNLLALAAVLFVSPQTDGTIGTLPIYEQMAAKVTATKQTPMLPRGYEILIPRGPYYTKVVSNGGQENAAALIFKAYFQAPGGGTGMISAPLTPDETEDQIKLRLARIAARLEAYVYCGC